MKQANDLMTGQKPKEEVLLYSLLLLRGCKTRAEVESALNGPCLNAWGYRDAVGELIKSLPALLSTLTKIYGEEGEK